MATASGEFTSAAIAPALPVAESNASEAVTSVRVGCVLQNCFIDRIDLVGVKSAAVAVMVELAKPALLIAAVVRYCSMAICVVAKYDGR